VQNAEDYDVSVARRIGEIKTVAEVVKEWDDAHNVRLFCLGIMIYVQADG
jgi:hypothetical protein